MRTNLPPTSAIPPSTTPALNASASTQTPDDRPAAQSLSPDARTAQREALDRQGRAILEILRRPPQVAAPASQGDHAPAQPATLESRQAQYALRRAEIFGNTPGNPGEARQPKAAGSRDELAKKNRWLSNQNKLLSDRVGDLSNQYKDLKETISGLGIDVSHVMQPHKYTVTTPGYLEQLQSSEQYAWANLNNLRRELNQIKGEKADVRLKLEASDAKISELVGKLDEMKAGHQATVDEYIKKIVVLTGSVKQTEELAKTIAELNEKNSEANAQVELLQQELNATKTVQEDQEQKLAAKNRELEEKNEQLAAEVTALLDENENLRAENDDLVAENDELKAENDDAFEVNGRCETEILSLREKLAASEARLNEIPAGFIDDVKSRIDYFSKQFDEKNAKIAEVKQENAALNEELERVRTLNLQLLSSSREPGAASRAARH